MSMCTPTLNPEESSSSGRNKKLGCCVVEEKSLFVATSVRS
jgi:hypothetical protein